MGVFSRPETRRELPLVPLRDIVVFPKMIVPFFVGRKSSIQAVEHAHRRGEELFLCTQKDPREDEPTMADVHAVGTVAKMLQMLRLPDGTIRRGP